MDVHFSSKTPIHGTPWELFNQLHAEFNFVVDVCANAQNAKCPLFYTKESDGLAQDWVQAARAHKGALWCNPPYGREIRHWVDKASRTARWGVEVAMLLPARTDTSWWHEFVWDATNNRSRPGVEVRFLKGRLKFLDPEGKPQDAAPFPSVVVIFQSPPQYSAEG